MVRLVLLATLGACGFKVAGGAVDASDDSGANEAGLDADMSDADMLPPAIVASGLIEDLDGDRGVMLSVTTVSKWANQVAGGDDVGAGAGGVTIAPVPVNGHTALRFPGTARLIGTDTNVFCPLTSGSGLTWFAVVSSGAQDHVLRNQIVGTIHEGTPYSGFTGGVNTATAKPYTMMRPTTIEAFAQSTRSAVGEWVVLAGRLQAGMGSRTTDVFFNSSSADGTATVNVTGTSMCGALVIGAERTLGTEFFTGDLARLLIYNRPLSTAEISGTGRALATHYGITAQF